MEKIKRLLGRIKTSGACVWIKNKYDVVSCFVTGVAHLFRCVFLKKDISGVEYQDLAPVDAVPDCQEHIKALEWAFANERIRNLALAGPYGSGKSSIINAFLKENPLLAQKSLRISLATFADIKDKEELRQEIQEGILKQLFYKVRQKDIPQSRYRKIHRVGYWHVFAITALCLAVLGVFAFVFCPGIFETTYDLVVAAGTKISLSSRASLFVFCAAVLILLVGVVRALQLIAFRITIKEIKLPDATIKSDSVDSATVLDKYADEIVYFFEETGYSVVFFEDLDRFDDAKIFIQLRELNTLLNNYDAISHRIVFVYAIKDDVFNDTERTKFFDFIIPVIPVINSTNSGEILLEMLHSEAAAKHDISAEYIMDISPYISEMRVLQNIYNEFVLYKETIKTRQKLTLSDEAMLSLIVFKNLYPKQFAELQAEKGIVKQAFRDKNRFIDAEISAIKERIENYDEILRSAQADSLNSVHELKFVMLCAVTQWKGIATSINNNGRTYSAAEILKDDFDMELLRPQGNYHVSYSKVTGGTMSEYVNGATIKAIFEEYTRRLSYLRESGEEQVTQMKAELEQLAKRMHTLSSWPLKDLISEFGTKSVLASPEVQANALLVFMLRRGYIDEKYADYINFFKENSITTEDKNFILAVKNQKPLPRNYDLSKISQVINRLQLHEFEEKAILNMKLLEHMLSSHEYDDKLDNFIQQLADETKACWEFVDEFIDRTGQVKRFIQMLAEKWSGLWDVVYEDPVLTYERKCYYLQVLCQHLDIETLSKQNEKGHITDFFEDHDDILRQFQNGCTQRIIQIIPALGITFYALNVDGVSPALLDFVFENKHYELNAGMIQSVVGYKNAGLCDRLETQNYTVVIELNYPALTEYVHENWEEYVSGIVLAEKNTQESVDCILLLLERSLSDIDMCEEIIEHEEFCVEKIEMVLRATLGTDRDAVHKIWDFLLAYDKVLASWENVQAYWEQFGLSEELIDYISKYVDILSRAEHGCLGDDFKGDMIKSDVGVDVFEKVLPCLYIEEFDVSLKEVDADKIAIMIERSCFGFDVSHYRELEACAPELCVKFIACNQDAFLACMDEINITSDQFEELVLNKTVKQETRACVVNRYGAELMTEAVAQELVELDISIDSAVFASVWKSVDDTEKRRRFLMKNLKILGEKEFEECFEGLSEPYCKLSKEAYRHDAVLPDGADNRTLATRLREIGYISSFELETRTSFDKKQGSSSVPVIRFRVRPKQ